MLSLRMLGGLLVRDGDQLVVGRLLQRYTVALLAILVASGARPVMRDRLVALLWPERPPARARHRLNVALHTIRRFVPPSGVVSVGNALYFDPSVVWTDVHEFEASCRQGDWRTAVALYGGPFLDGFHLPGCGEEFERWLEQTREDYAREFSRAIESLAMVAENEQRMADAAGWWGKLVVQNPFSERAVARWLGALAVSGDVREAIHRYEEHAALLRDELDMEPAPEVVRVFQGISDPATRTARHAGGAEEPGSRAIGEG